ncbi:hypothetical protein BGX34_005137 [Mortierella sp. NVP85]|nr:hypothetical protein BGX34_005137 [Mortierella sp. NVP85]
MTDHHPLPTTTDGYIDATLVEDRFPRQWDQESVDSDLAVSEYSTTSSRDIRDIQREWDENMEQARQLFAIVIVPFAGRWLGKKFSHWRMFSLYPKHSHPSLTRENLRNVFRL